MTDLDFFFSDDRIIALLCKLRIKYARHRHKVHMARDISFYSKTLENLRTKHIIPNELSRMLPPRRQWLRLTSIERKKFSSGVDINIEGLRKTILTTKYRIATEGHSPPEWYRNLKNFLLDIKLTMQNLDDFEFKKPSIIGVKKDNTPDCNQFRPICQYNLLGRIIIGQVARYLTVVFDEFFLDCSYAFRSSSGKSNATTHHDTILGIERFRKDNRDKKIYVSECDIKKFYDCVQHEHIIFLFKQFVTKLTSSGKPYDGRATALFLKYLDSYAFNLDVLPLNSNGFFNGWAREGSRFDWPTQELADSFYGDEILNYRIGVPQGGALSCLIANILLHNVDEAVTFSEHAKEMGYFRFCDDMILLTTDERSSELLLGQYQSSVFDNFLLLHQPEAMPIYGSQTYRFKSKQPHLWSKHERLSTATPWISFVGYQIRYDGVIRVRKSSLKKEAVKQENEAKKVLAALNAVRLHDINRNSRKSLRQQLFSLEARFLAMSIGKRTIYNYKTKASSLCWAVGFKALKRNATSSNQMRYLDSRRSRQLFVLKRKLVSLTRTTEGADVKNNATRYFGHPFSYSYFLRDRLVRSRQFNS